MPGRVGHRVTPFLTFAKGGEAAVRTYVKLLPNSRIRSLARYGAGGMMPKGALMTAEFELDGAPFYAMDGGETFAFAHGVSLFVACTTQAEIDRYWSVLVRGGTPSRCGWLQDRWGLSWQIVPTSLGRMLGDPAHGDTGAALQAMLTMEKLDLARLTAAYEGRAPTTASRRPRRR